MISRKAICMGLLGLVIIYKGYKYEDNIVILVGGLTIASYYLNFEIKKNTRKTEKIVYKNQDDNEEWHQIDV